MKMSTVGYFAKNLGLKNWCELCQYKFTNAVNAKWMIKLDIRHFSSSSSSSGSEDLLVKVQNGVRKITLNRPTKKNAATLDMCRQLASSLHQSNTDDATTIVVITGQGDYFTSGLDMSGPKPGKDSSSQDKIRHSSSDKPSQKPPSLFTAFATSFIDCKKPLIALINGPAFGFGVTMLGLFDSVYTSDKAFFQTNFTLYGLPPEFCSTYTFPRIMGYGRANQLLVKNTRMTAQEAFQAGLVSRVFVHKDFEKETSKLMEEFGTLPLKSLMYSKELVRGRERELLKKVSEKEQSYFDPKLAREVKIKFMSKTSK